ncbi:MAG: hypothetical protein JNL11_02795 [Bdellovibrionaceae bacterium]|nr:hypothetical protein [Pseudobdellovibrionaceae bacterium]
MKSIFLILTLLVLSQSVSAIAYFKCFPNEGKYKGSSVITMGPDDMVSQDAANLILAKPELYEAKTLRCERWFPPTPGSAEDLAGKKWKFIGGGLDSWYLVFQNQHLLHIQECGQVKMIHKFKVEQVGTQSFKLTEDGIEGQCSTWSVPGFKTGSIISTTVTNNHTEGWHLLISDSQPGESTSFTSFYKQIP